MSDSESRHEFVVALFECSLTKAEVEEVVAPLRDAWGLRVSLQTLDRQPVDTRRIFYRVTASKSVDRYHLFGMQGINKAKDEVRTLLVESFRGRHSTGFLQHHPV